jgi:hypothetical protein
MPAKERFETKGINSDELKIIGALASRFAQLAEDIEMVCPENRYRSVALTNLEQGCMWATKSISHKEVK